MNKTVPLRGFGGGGALLNFNVVKNPQPVNPSPNTIWLNTDRKINGYSFSAKQPENMAEGEVWFPVGVSSPIAFSTTKKNPVMVYPLSAHQKIDGALVEVTAKIYQGGKWVDWIVYLYKNGDVCTSATGGWVKKGVPDGGSMTVGSFELKENCIHVQTNGYSVSFASTANLVDVAPFKTLEVTVLSGGWGTRSLRLCPSGYAWKTGSTAVAEIGLKEGVNSLDISGLTDSYYIAIHAYSDAGTSSVVDVSEVVLK